MSNYMLAGKSSSMLPDPNNHIKGILIIHKIHISIQTDNNERNIV